MLVVDDNAVVRGGLVSLLADVDDIDVVGEAATGREAIDRARVLRPDVVLLDVRMPVMDGVSAAAHLAGDAAVLMLTYSDEPGTVTGAIRAGASGYLVHGEFDPGALAEAIRTVHRGGSVVSDDAAATVFAALRASPTGPADDQHGLTARERDIIELIVQGRSNQEIADELVIAHKTVKNHISRIYDKLGAGSRTEAVATWLGVPDVRDGRGGRS